MSKHGFRSGSRKDAPSSGQGEFRSSCPGVDINSLMLRNGFGTPSQAPIGPMRRRGNGCQPACKPGSVGPVRPCGLADVTAIPLGRSLPTASSNQPGWRDRKTGPSPCGLHHPYSVLLPAGLAMPLPLPAARCALTAPFHPYPERGPDRDPAQVQGGLLSVALSLGSPPPDVIRRRVSMEPGLSSARTRRPSSRLAWPGIWGSRRRVNREPLTFPANASHCVCPRGAADRG